MDNTSGFNARILVIDDEESVRDSFRVILRPPAAVSEDMNVAASILFGDAPVAQRDATLAFELDVATSGNSGAQMVEAAVASGRPYAVIFCDMRMPGWDGVETIEEIRRHDQRAEVVFITAYSDYSVETILARAGANVGYFVKPFLTEEVKQLATKLLLEWNKARQLEDLMRALTPLRGEMKDMERLLQYLLSQICSWLDTESAALLRVYPGGSEFCVGVGALGSADSAIGLLDQAKRPAQGDDVMYLSGGTMFLPIQQFGVAIAILGRTKITPERRFLLQVFLEHAALAIRNSRMQTELAESQRMAAIGQALGFILHDIRGPIGIGQTMMRYLRSGSQRLGSREELLDQIETCMQQALDMVSDTLHFSGDPIVVERESAPLAKIIDSAVRVFRVDVEQRGVRLDVAVPSDLHVYVDAERLSRALWNLTKNALDAVANAAGPRVEIGAAPSAGGVAIWVNDNGPGLLPEVASKLFLPFASAKRAGTGFGLAIVKQIVEAHGGRVTVERRGDTTRFEMFFPDAGCAAIQRATTGTSA